MTARSAASRDQPRGPTTRRARRAFVPPQHGAWAFLALPLVLGASVATWTPPLLPLAVAWVAAYPMSYAAFGLVRAKRPQRFKVPFIIWTAIVLPSAAIALVWRPWLLWIGLAYSALLIVNLRYARRGDERALVNDAVFVAECAGMVAVTWAVGAGERSWNPPALDAVPAHVWILVTVCALVLFGSTLHVKSLIRERRDPQFARASRVVAVASVPASMFLGIWWGWPSGAWLAVPFVALAVRSFVVPRRALRPGAIGIIELSCFLLVAAAAILAAT
ncbi:MAG: hypothetical protein F2806_02000 [Actinobacteria bacterium]|uniref:Unannotated protein n=1 Tax=freshwater metagenome TaxID=449393 RepID=A0A6J7FD32_9ZZZZ|nr:hypothetical protein [Actinomycetota bacterium]